MRWDDFRRSDNIEDRRDSGPMASGGGMSMGGGGLGIGGLIIVGLISWALGIDPRILIGGLEMVQGPGSQQQAPATPSKTGTPADQQGQFIAAVLGDSEDRWTEIFRQQYGRAYTPPRLVIFRGGTQSGCGFAQTAMGPFYCPRDQRVYLDTSFFNDLERRFNGCSGKACQFSQAYVITHEVGHHVQNLLGILPKVQEAQQSMSDRDRNALQVRVELQADCLAGVWANRSEQKWNFLEPGDIQAALQTASAIGDDRLQRQTQGYVVPDSFTHGSSAQRMQWFQAGFKNGLVSDCNTFGQGAI
ncbi:MAG TPA: neutral zinc metallopeptidase [Xanthobacteraceae bacterium]|nr:neutral zinc metallopeptidase [Xanthobacteraceae bacterium]